MQSRTPWDRCARRAASSHGWTNAGIAGSVARIAAQLFGSLALTGQGHGTDKAVLLGLEGEWPDKIDSDAIPSRLARIRSERKLRLLGKHEIAFDENDRPRFQQAPEAAVPSQRHALHRVRRGRRRAADARLLLGRRRLRGQPGRARREDRIVRDTTPLPYPFHSGDELLRAVRASPAAPSRELMLRNETSLAQRSRNRARAARDLDGDAGLRRARLPRRRRAARRPERAAPRAAICTTNCATARKRRCAIRCTVLDWVNLYALAVNEENAAGGRVVTAPTNGAAGIIPAVLHYYARFVPGATERAASSISC